MIFRPFFASLPEGKRGLLLIDNARAHFDGIQGDIAKSLDKLRVDILLLHPNSSSILHPNDLGINKPIKKNLEMYWE